MQLPPLTRARLAPAFAALLAASLGLSACGGGGGGTASPGGGAAASGTTSGPAYTMPTRIATATMDRGSATEANDSAIDVSHANDGYACAAATSEARLKFLVTCGEQSYAYDLPSDGTPITIPINMGDGSYSFQVMQNTSGNNYVAINSVTADVSLTSEFAPYLLPNMYCDFDDGSACVARARELAANAENEGDVVQAVFDYITSHVSYDSAKAEQLATTTGYVPDPDETLATGKGICFDYASLGAAMLRSLGIPAQIKTGYVSPGDIYHAWVMIYIDGKWESAEFSVSPDTWTRMDLTFAAADDTSHIGDGTSYEDRFTY